MEHWHLHGHDLEVHAEIEGGDADARYFLKGPYERSLRDAEALDTCAGDDEVGIRLSDVIGETHFLNSARGLCFV